VSVPASVLVTGAAGFVGAEVVRRLADRGHVVHAYVRRPSERPPAGARHEHVGDLCDAAALARALTRARAEAEARGAALDVVHLAARISYRRAEAPELERVNVGGTRALLAACATARVRRLCHVSSVVALGPVARADLELDDDAALGGRALASAYARTKAEAEALVLAADGLDRVVASPAVVFGLTGTGSNSLHFLRRAVRGRLGPLAPPGSLSVVALDDTAEGILAVLARGQRGRRYLLAESAWRLDELLGLAARLGGQRGPRVRLGARAWRLVVGGARLAERVVPSERATAEALALLGMHFRFRARRARSELGWTPRPFAEVLSEIVAALRAAQSAGP
jgi:dihydroflavonol-4-reductase